MIVDSDEGVRRSAECALKSGELTEVRLLLLTPSIGFGGGIERVTRAIEGAWDGPLDRLDLYDRAKHDVAAGNPWAKMVFAAKSLAAAKPRPDVVLALHVGLLPVAAMVSAVARADVGLMAHGREVWAPMRPGRRAMIRRCSDVLAVSSFTKFWIAQRAGVDSGRVSVIPLPVDEVLAERAFSMTRSAGPHCNLLTVSRIDRGARYKGHFEIAQSLPLVLARQRNARWIVAGEGDDLDALRARCRDLGVAEAVTFLGHISDAELATLYVDAAALVLPSVADVAASSPTGEGFGLVYAEAGAFGVPSIASAAGGGSLDFVINECTGLVVPPADSQSLAAAMLRLLEDHELRKRLGMAARQRVRERHLMQHFRASIRSTLSRNRHK
jgi:phosphatidyl-myo-inositol dimannoside synthase